MPRRLLVADSGPLIALARLELLHLPGALFDQVLVTDTVWNEVTAAPVRAEHGALHAALLQGWLAQAREPADQPPALAGIPLDAGERSVLAVALAAGCDVLIDERRGRRVAHAAGLQVLGTLGMLLRARQLGLIGPARPLVEQLVASGYHLAPVLVARTLDALGE
jgi:uncharacterized protein